METDWMMHCSFLYSYGDLDRRNISDRTHQRLMFCHRGGNSHQTRSSNFHKCYEISIILYIFTFNRWLSWSHVCLHVFNVSWCSFTVIVSFFLILKKTDKFCISLFIKASFVISCVSVFYSQLVIKCKRLEHRWLTHVVLSLEYQQQ